MRRLKLTIIKLRLTRINLQRYACAFWAVLGIEVTACVTILDKVTRRPPARGALFHTGREAPK